MDCHPLMPILSKNEQEKFISGSTFTLQEKQYFFKIPEIFFRDLNSSKNKFLITLLWGSFKSTNKFILDLKTNPNIETVLKELGNIMKTDFLLNYIDDVGLRQRIEKQLNKVEASNKFSKAVFFGNSSEFTVATVEEQNIANNSKRLIQNAIILWNYMYITKKLQDAPNQKEKDEMLEALKNSSMVIYFFVNFYGIYNFQSNSKRIHRLIVLDETKGFMNAIGLEK